MSVQPGPDNRRHLYRHAVRALEDFERLNDGLVIGNYRQHNVNALLHSISHHLRHTVYRSGIESNWWMPPVRKLKTGR